MRRQVVATAHNKSHTPMIMQNVEEPTLPPIPPCLSAMPGTFTPIHSPVTNDKLSGPELLDLQMSKSPYHPCYIYTDRSNRRVKVSMKHFVHSVHWMSKNLSNYVANEQLDLLGPIVIGVLVETDSISYMMLVHAIMRAGHVPFLISTRNSPEGLAHLLNVTQTRCIFLSSTGDVHSLFRDTQSVQLQISDEKMPVFEMSSYTEFRTLHPVGLHESELLPRFTTPSNMDDPGIIIHSSGSTTSFSRPIVYTHQMCVQWALIFLYGEQNLCGEVISCHWNLMFHSTAMFPLWASWTTGATMAFSGPDFLQPVKYDRFARLNLIKHIKAAGCTLVWASPAFLEAWADDKEAVDLLKQTKFVLYGGADLRKDVGNYLVEQGVRLGTFYGSAESFPLSKFFPRVDPPEHRVDWDYFSFPDYCQPVIKPVQYANEESHRLQGSSLFTLTVLQHDHHKLTEINTTVDGQPGYRIGDLIEKHPFRENLWRFKCRADDVLVLKNGINIYPEAYEAQLVGNPNIEHAMVFGNGENRPGVLLEVKQGAEEDRQPSAFWDELWVTVDAANRTVIADARVSREMIILASPLKPFLLTPKQNQRRAATLDLYENEICDLYN